MASSSAQSDAVMTCQCCGQPLPWAKCLACGAAHSPALPDGCEACVEIKPTVYLPMLEVVRTVKTTGQPAFPWHFRLTVDGVMRESGAASAFAYLDLLLWDAPPEASP